MDKNKPVIIVTGFGPFGSHLINASWEAVRLLHRINLEEECGACLITEKIPVAYDEVNEIVPNLWLNNPTLMVHVGVSDRAKQVTLESSANKDGYYRYDVKNQTLPDGFHCFGMEDCIKTNIDLEFIKFHAGVSSVDLDISHDVGRYLCEYIYYTSLRIDPCRTIFLHVPPISENYPASKIAEHIKTIIKLALDQLRKS